jgi:hypothetical protein
MTAVLRRWGYRRVISTAITTVVLLIFSYVLYQQWQAGHFNELKYPLAPILLSALGMFGLAVMLGFLWCWILRLLSNKRMLIKPLLYAHFVSWIARYIPGKISQIAGKVVLSEGLGYRRGVLIASVFYENAFFIGSGISIVLLCLGPGSLTHILSPGWSEPWITVFALALISGLLLSVYFLPSVMRRFLRSQGGLDGSISSGSVMLLFVSYHFTHLSAGLGFYLLLELLAPLNNVPLIVAIGILTAAHIGGVLAIVVPAGLGVRESILALLLASYMPMDQAIVISAVTRIWSTAADGYVLASIPILGIVRKRI